MVGRYTLNISNRSGEQTAFMIIAETPKVECGDGTKVYTTVYQRSSTVQPGRGRAAFEIDTSAIAVCLTSSNLSPGNQVEVSGEVPVSLGTPQNRASVVQASYDQDSQAGSFGKVTEAGDSNRPANGFVIKTDGGWRYPTRSNFCLGIGARSHDQIVPLAFFPAKPNTTYQIVPKTTFYITTSGGQSPGEIINIETLGDVMAINFGPGKTDFGVSYNPDGTFSLS